MVDWRIQIANDPEGPPWWFWFIAAIICIILTIIFN